MEKPYLSAHLHAALRQHPFTHQAEPCILLPTNVEGLAIAYLIRSTGEASARFSAHSVSWRGLWAT